MKQVSICIVVLGVQYDLWNIAWAWHSVGNVFSHLKTNLENKQYVIATYFCLRDWKQIFIGNGFLISIEMNMMTDNEYMPLDASQPSQNDQVYRQGEKKRLHFSFFFAKVDVWILAYCEREKEGGSFESRQSGESRGQSQGQL